MKTEKDITKVAKVVTIPTPALTNNASPIPIAPVNAKEDKADKGFSKTNPCSYQQCPAIRNFHQKM